MSGVLCYLEQDTTLNNRALCCCHAGLAARRGVELFDLVMGTPQLLEWLGGIFITRDAILGESD